MSSVYTSRPPVSDDTVPIDLDIPDNYVSQTLKKERALPPVTWSNWYKEISPVSTGLIVGLPLLGFTGAYFTPLRWQTALFAVVYYYITGLGMFLSIQSSADVSHVSYTLG
jgi:stearoyl-CoA desaturase (Delta-9 desaturase)